MATAAISRRALFGRLRGGGAQLRPPWSRSEPAFTDECTRCGACMEACPTSVIGKGHGGYPIVDFSRGYCTFCGKCAEICESDCFASSNDEAPWRLEALIGDACIERSGVACRVCQDACEHGAIAFRPLLGGRSQPSVASDRCTGCGACVGTCPVRAIFVDIPQTEAEEISA